jgi:beta-phosphoglucomutase
MEQHLEAWQHAFSRYKTTVKEKDFYYLEGRGVKSVVEMLTDKYGIDTRQRQIIMEEKIRYYNSIFKAEFYDGLYSLLDTLRKRGLKLGVVTGGLRNRVTAIISEFFDGYFSAIVTSDDVENTKPFPEPYLKGAHLLGLKNNQCVVVENAPMGIKAAKNAGISVIAITSTLEKEDLKEADYIYNNFGEVEGHILKHL